MSSSTLINSDSTVVLKETLEDVLASLQADTGMETIDALRPILFSNLKKGRLFSFTEGDPQKVKNYVLKVAEIYARLHDYLVKVQVDRDDLTWGSLFEQLQKLSKSYFIRKGFNPAQVNDEIAFGQATEAAMIILMANFPYDTEFEPWVNVIVQNCCLKYMRSSMKGTVIPAQKIEVLDDVLSETLTNSEEKEQAAERDLLADVITAIEQLPILRKTVINYRYLGGLSSDEIAAKIGKSKTEVYSLHFNAIRDIQKILGLKGIN